MTPLLVGAGRSDVRYPPETWPLDGFTGVHDPLCVRVLVLDGDERVVWAVVDQTSLAPAPLAAVQQRLAGIAGVAVSSVLVSVSHTFSAPHLADPADVPSVDAARMRGAWAAVLDAVSSAAAAALDSLAPARLGAGVGRCAVAVNRDVETPDGWGLGRNEAGFSDDTVTVLRIDSLDGRCRGLIVSAGVQPSVLNGSTDADGGRLVTADLAGAAMTRLERYYDGAVAMFVIGAAGDQAPSLTAVRSVPEVAGEPAVHRDAGADGFVIADLLGERLAQAAVTVAEVVEVRDAAPVVALTAGSMLAEAQEPTPRERIVPTRSHGYRAAGERALPWSVLRLGDIAIACVQPELSAVTGRAIRDRSPFSRTVVATLVNGGAKYLPEREAFDRFTYEALSSFYARGTAEALAEVVVTELQRIRHPEHPSTAAATGRRPVRPEETQ